jgi:hypothetical protein
MVRSILKKSWRFIRPVADWITSSNRRAVEADTDSMCNRQAVCLESLVDAWRTASSTPWSVNV